MAEFTDEQMGLGAPAKREFTDAEMGVGAPAPSRVSEGFDALNDKPPQAFVDRIATGAVALRNIMGVPYEFGKEIGRAGIEGTVDQLKSINDRLNPFSDAYRKGFESGAWTGPGTFVGVGKGLFDVATLPLAPAGSALTETIAQPYSKITGMPIEEARNAASTALLALRPSSTGGAHFSRPVMRDGVMQEQQIGTLPKPADFQNGAELLGDRNKVAVSNLQRLWGESGVHPAEAVHDAKSDAFLKHDLTEPIEAYHGSPHDFTAFSTEKIGTGEGAQSYGHGLYFAESESVARSYRDKLADLKIAPAAYADPDLGPRLKKAETDVMAANAAFAKIDENIFAGRSSSVEAEKAVRAERARASDALEKVQDEAYAKYDSGNLYRVRINADQEKMLDLDKSLKDQTPEVQAAVKRAMGVDYYGNFDQAKSDRLWAEHQHADGKTAVRNGFVAFDDKTVATRLSEAGIPGLKYLDSGSRQAGEGSRNFVVFDDKAVEITHKNGEAFYDERFNNAQNEKWYDHVLSGKGEDVPLRALGADVAATPPLVPLSKQPASPPGSLLGAASNAVDQLMGLGRNIQFMLDPMATGSNRAMVVAKDAINSVRRIRWDHARIDAEAVKTFEPEQRARMWSAADEESVALQLGESREHQGLATLEPHERAFIEDAHARAQNAWVSAVDAGIVEGEGLPAYTPRMVLNVASASADLGPRALNELGRNVFTRTAQMNRRGYMTAEETEAAAKRLVGQRMAERGASMDEINTALEKVKIARDIRALPLATARLQEAVTWRRMINQIEEHGKATGNDTVSVGYKPDNSWFTIAGNPAFTKWEPLFDSGGKARLDEAGNAVMVPKPIYMHPEYRGPMTAILDEAPSNSKAVAGAQSAYQALMAVKGKAMTAILNSPLIHNEVVWSKVAEAAGFREWLGFGLYFKGNRIVNGNPARAGELIERGLNPMGPRGSFQDITSMMEQPNIDKRYHESWTGKIAGYIPGLFDPAAGTAVESAIAKAGNFVHNTLLWDRVRDVHFGLADHLSDHLVAKGADRMTADRVATHFANIIVGSIPKEAMSSGARATANLLLFSRSFTLGNLSTFKQATLGLPKPILAQIERDFGVSADAALPEAAQEQVSQTANSIARRKAISTIAISAGLYYVGNALIQHAFNIAARDSTVSDELQGYARRYQSLMNDVKTDPFEMRHLLGRLSPTYDNEPAKSDRAHIGYDKDGTAIYARNPTGKFGEEMIGYPTKPMTMIKQKLSPLAGGILDVLENDRGFGRKIYDENDRTIGGDVATAFAVSKYMVMKHLPEGQYNALVDLLRGDGDPAVNRLRLVAPMAGFTVSEGAPGGMARGEQLAAKQQFDAKFGLAWPDIKKQIQRGEIDKARAAMDEIHVPPQMQKGLIRNAMDPASSLRGRTLKNFYQSATPEQIDRMERAGRQ